MQMKPHNVGVRRAIFALLLVMIGLGGCTATSNEFKPVAQESKPAAIGLKPYSIYSDFRQTVDFETAAIPGNIFRIVIPEIITDKKDTLVPWSQESPNWDIGPDHAGWECKVPKVIRMKADVHFGDQVIDANVEITNLSQRNWELANAFTCFTFYAAPTFDNPQMDRVYFPVGGKWRSVADLFREHDPGRGPYTFFPVEGGPALSDMNICRLVPQRHPQVIDYGAGCVVSRDAQWVAGVNAEHPAYVFCNRRERCIHANPVYEPIAPGQTARGTTHIRILRGGIADFERAVRP
jgi:hypothetical protein